MVAPTELSRSLGVRGWAANRICRREHTSAGVLDTATVSDRQAPRRTSEGSIRPRRGPSGSIAVAAERRLRRHMPRRERFAEAESTLEDTPVRVPPGAAEREKLTGAFSRGSLGRCRRCPARSPWTPAREGRGPWRSSGARREPEWPRAPCERGPNPAEPEPRGLPRASDPGLRVKPWFAGRESGLPGVRGPKSEAQVFAILHKTSLLRD
jgi:hypothetical protein